MTLRKFRIILVGTALLLPACSFTQEALWPSLTGEKSTATDTKNQTPPPPDGGQGAGQATEQASTAPLPPPGGETAAMAPKVAQTGQPPLGTGDFSPGGVTPGQPTGTYVGKKVEELRKELKQLQVSIGTHNQSLQQIRSRIIQDSQRYHGTVAAINARLQVGTTPGNPILVQQFNSAESDLDRLSVDIGDMNRLATDVTSDSTMSSYLSESARAAFSLSGAVDEDHRQLAILEDEINRTVVLIDRLLKEVSGDVRRQTSYVETERSNLNVLLAGVKSGEIYGANLINRAMASVGGGESGGRLAPRAAVGNRRPLVIIRFDRPNVPYQQALYNAVSRVLEARPDATFDLVAVTPAAGGPAQVALNSNKSRRLTEGVLRSLVDMGLPPNRITLSARTSDGTRVNEAQLFVR